jgi:hypothetical protein
MFHQSDKHPANSLSFYLAVVLSRQYIFCIRSYLLLVLLTTNLIYIVYGVDYRGL